MDSLVHATWIDCPRGLHGDNVMVNPFEETLEAGRINPREQAARDMMQVGIGSLSGRPSRPQYETVGDQMRGEGSLETMSGKKILPTQMNDWGGNTSLLTPGGDLNWPSWFQSYWGKIGLRDAVKDHREEVLNPEDTLAYLQSEIFDDEMARDAGYHPSGTNLRQGSVGIERMFDIMKGKLGVGAAYDVDDNLFNMYLKYSH